MYVTTTLGLETVAKTELATFFFLFFFKHLFVKHFLQFIVSMKCSVHTTIFFIRVVRTFWITIALEIFRNTVVIITLELVITTFSVVTWKRRTCIISNDNVN